MTSTSHSLSVDVWAIILSLLPVRELLRLRFLCRTFNDDIFPLTLFRCLTMDSVGGCVHAKLKAAGSADRSLGVFTMKPTRYTRKDGGRYVFTASQRHISQEWLQVDGGEPMQGSPHFAFWLPFWQDTWSDDDAGVRSRLDLIKTQLSSASTKPRHQESDQIAAEAKQRWLHYFMNTKLSMSRCYFVPVSQLPSGIHHVGCGSLIATYEIRTSEEGPVAGGKEVRLLNVTVTLRWILAGLKSGLSPDLETERMSDAMKTVTLMDHLPKQIFLNVWTFFGNVFSIFLDVVDPDDPRVLSFLDAETSSMDRYNATTLIQSLLSEWRGEDSVVIPADVMILRRRRLLERGLAAKGINPDFVWAHGFSRRWIASGDFNGPCSDGKAVLERLVGVVVELERLRALEGVGMSEKSLLRPKTTKTWWKWGGLFSFSNM
ncbi:hypothetical protein BC829DRAFT_387108 [Chytridium lagenaria]|nr:hypothetical protein BC829DRAFT_387108 [Chytridium lagenaria]